MKIDVNGEPRDVPEATTITGLLQQLDLAGKRLAVELNREIVPRSRHDQQRLAEGDRVELVQAIGGG